MKGPIKPVGLGLNTWSAAENPKIDKRNPHGQLVYRVVALDAKGAPIPIKRNSGVDKEGILYIGETETPKRGELRYRKLVRSFANPGRKNKHGAAEKYFALGFAPKYPLDQLRVQYKLLAKPKREVLDVFTVPEGKPLATTGETSDLRSYENKYGERPPLNDVRGKRLLGPRPPTRSPKSAGKGVKMGKEPYAVLRRIRTQSGHAHQ